MIVIASNRGPLSAAGGLVTGLRPLLDQGAMWIAAAVTDTDRAAPPSDQVVLLDFDSETFRLAYDVVANETLWFLHHGLWDLARQPTFDSAWRQAWVAYEHYNEAFATAICERAPADSVVLVQDYHLALTGELVRVRRPDLRTVHFTHTAYATPEEQGALPADVRQRLAVGMAGFDRCGFHSARWEQRYRRGAETIGAQPPDTFVAPLAPDASGLRSVAGSAECDTKLAAIDAAADGRFLLVRVDRLELSKNILRGFLAFDSLLRRRADLRGHITFAAYVHASRTGVEAYRRYAEEIRHAAAAINERFGTPKWTPVLLETTDDFARSVAALRRYDALLVNPIRDGLNLVALEGPLVNERSGSVLCSTEAGVFDQLGGAAIEVHPFDVEATAAAIETAVDSSVRERVARADELRGIAEARTPADWLAAQLEVTS